MTTINYYGSSDGILTRGRRNQESRMNRELKVENVQIKVRIGGGGGLPGCTGFVLPYGRFMRSLYCDNLYHGYHYDQVIPSIKRRATACITDRAIGPGSNPLIFEIAVAV